METEKFTVMKTGFIAGSHREKGATFQSTERAMRYPMLNGLVENDELKKIRLAKQAQEKDTKPKTNTASKDTK